MAGDTSSQLPQVKISRRQLLVAGVAGVLGGFLGAIGAETKEHLDAPLRLLQGLGEKLSLPEERQRALLRMFATQGETLLVAGRDNPLQKGLHPDDKYTADKVKDMFSSRSVSYEMDIQYDESAHLVCLGGPQSNIDSLYHLWYERLADGQLLPGKNKPYSLPFEYGYPPLDRLGELPSIRRYVGEQLSERPPYFLKLNVPVPSLRVSEITSNWDGEMWLSEDWLVLSKVPHRDVAGKFVIVAGGLHGTGTKAFGQVVHDLDIAQLRQMDEQREGHPYFQSLFHVPRVLHKHGRNPRSMPVAVEHVVTFPLVVYPDRT